MHLTGGILRHFRAFSTPEQNPALGVLSTPAHPQVTQTVRPHAFSFWVNKFCHWQIEFWGLLAIGSSQHLFFSAASFFLVGSTLAIGVSSYITCSAYQLFGLIGRLPSQVHFNRQLFFLVMASCSQSCHNIGRFLGGVVLSAMCRAPSQLHFSRLVVFSCHPCGLTTRAPDLWESPGLWLGFVLGRAWSIRQAVSVFTIGSSFFLRFSFSLPSILIHIPTGR